MVLANDVSAVLLTIGEPTFAWAEQSLLAQSRPARDVIVVRDVVPFHRALNAGATQVRTPFFVQVDADMVLDPSCLDDLRSGVSWRSGIVVGQLRDDLLGRVVGVKLFRTACFRAAPFRDSISPDTDFGNEIARQGWMTTYLGRPRHAAGTWKTFGAHRPSYTPAYTFRKYVLEGGRLRHRGDPGGARWLYGRLSASAHESAPIAEVALAQGLYLEPRHDLLGPLEDVAGARHLERLLAKGAPAAHAAAEPAIDRWWEGLTGLDLYEVGQARGRSFATHGDWRHAVRSIGMGGADALVAKVAFCRGLLAEATGGATIADEYQELAGFMNRTFAEPRHDSGRQLVRGMKLAGRRLLWRC